MTHPADWTPLGITRYRRRWGRGALWPVVLMAIGCWTLVVLVGWLWALTLWWLL